MSPLQGEVWWSEIEDIKARPVLIVTRDEAIPVLNRILAAPITRTVRGIPTEVALGPKNGLADDCVATFDNLQWVSKALLTRRYGALENNRRNELCAAIRAVVDC